MQTPYEGEKEILAWKTGFLAKVPQAVSMQAFSISLLAPFLPSFLTTLSPHLSVYVHYIETETSTLHIYAYIHIHMYTYMHIYTYICTCIYNPILSSQLLKLIEFLAIDSSTLLCSQRQ